mgnify:CR=1 FL=1
MRRHKVIRTAGYGIPLHKKTKVIRRKSIREIVTSSPEKPILSQMPEGLSDPVMERLLRTFGSHEYDALAP